MIEAAETIQYLIAGRTREQFGSDVGLQLALVRAIEILGEAATGISQECRRRSSAVPWRAIIATRNRLIHAYFGC